MRKRKIVGLVMGAWLVISPAQAWVDVPNLIQNTITAVQEVYSYAKEVQDWVKTANYYLDNLDNLGNQLLAQTGIKDGIGMFNEISEMYSDFSNLYKDMDEFREGVLKDPKGFIDNKLKNNYNKYKLFDNCANLKGDEKNICLRETISYAFAYDEFEKNKQNILDLEKKLNDLQKEKKFGETEDIKEAQDRANQLSQIQYQAQQLQLKLLQDLQRFQIEQKEIEDKKQQMLAKNLNTTTKSSKWLVPQKYQQYK